MENYGTLKDYKYWFSEEKRKWQVTKAVEYKYFTLIADF